MEEEKSVLTADERAELKFISSNIKLIAFFGQTNEKSNKEIIKCLEKSNTNEEKIINLLEKLDNKCDQLLRKW